MSLQDFFFARFFLKKLAFFFSNFFFFFSKLRRAFSSAPSFWRGRLDVHFREIRFVFSRNEPGAKGIKDFILKNYTELKTLNPNLPLLIRDTDQKIVNIIRIFFFFFCAF
jgi:hypothetical protein